MDLAREDIFGLIDRLIVKMTERGTRGRIDIFGGSAICYYHSNRQRTQDIDSYIYPLNPILALAEEIASETDGLADGWINNHVMAVIPPTEDQSPTIYYDADGIVVTVASEEYLLAMKAVTERKLDRDVLDASILMNSLGLSAVEDIAAVVTRYFPDDEDWSHMHSYWEDIVDEAQGILGS